MLFFTQREYYQNVIWVSTKVSWCENNYCNSKVLIGVLIKDIKLSTALFCFVFFYSELLMYQKMAITSLYSPSWSTIVLFQDTRLSEKVKNIEHSIIYIKKKKKTIWFIRNRNCNNEQWSDWKIPNIQIIRRFYRYNFCLKYFSQ